MPRDKRLRPLNLTDGQKLEPLASLAEQFIVNPPPSPLLERWGTIGERGVLPPAVTIGTEWYSTRSAFCQFLEELCYADQERCYRVHGESMWRRCDVSDDIDRELQEVPPFGAVDGAGLWRCCDSAGLQATQAAL